MESHAQSFRILESTEVELPASFLVKKLFNVYKDLVCLQTGFTAKSQDLSSLQNLSEYQLWTWNPPGS
jgi:hypothetical protein